MDVLYCYAQNLIKWLKHIKIFFNQKKKHRKNIEDNNTFFGAGFIKIFNCLFSHSAHMMR
jgi:hypothetical protein